MGEMLSVLNLLRVPGIYIRNINPFSRAGDRSFLNRQRPHEIVSCESGHQDEVSFFQIDRKYFLKSSGWGRQFLI
jgi:hypothetical protein